MQIEVTTSTNDDKPFEPMEIISFSGDLFTVESNAGNSGTVREYPNGVTISPFYWRFEGEPCCRANVA